MGNGMNKIVNGLYLGNFRDSRDETQLSQNKITHILSIHDNAKALRDDKVYLCLNASDTPTQNLSQYFSQCNDFIHKARLDGGAVLVHCLAGVSRSATIVVAYIMSVTNCNYRQALDAVRGARQCASPNFGFQRQLVTFEIENLEQERQRLEKLYSRTPSQREQDNLDCKILIDITRDSDIRIARARYDHFVSVADAGKSDVEQLTSTAPVAAAGCGGGAASLADSSTTSQSSKPDLSCRNMRNMLDELVATVDLHEGRAPADHQTDGSTVGAVALQDTQVSSTCNDGTDRKPGPCLAGSEVGTRESSSSEGSGGSNYVTDDEGIDTAGDEDDPDLVIGVADGITVEC